MDVHIRIAVRVRDFLIVDFAEPIVSGDGAGVGENETTDGIGDGRVLLDAPVGDFEVAVDDVLEVEGSSLHLTEGRVTMSIVHVGAGDFDIASLDEDDFDGVLDILNGNGVVLDLLVEVRGDTEG